MNGEYLLLVYFAASFIAGSLAYWWGVSFLASWLISAAVYVLLVAIFGIGVYTLEGTIGWITYAFFIFDIVFIMFYALTAAVHTKWYKCFCLDCKCGKNGTSCKGGKNNEDSKVKRDESIWGDMKKCCKSKLIQ